MIDLALLQLAAPAIESPQPQEARSLYEQGVEARHAGAFSEALALFEARLAEAPDDVDARLNAALCLIALDRLPEAERELDRVIEAAPDYTDAYVALARIERIRVAQAAAPLARHMTDDDAVTVPAREEGRLTASLVLSRSALTKDLPDWTSISPALAKSVSDTLSVHASLLHAERFDTSNTTVTLGAAKRTGFGHVRLEVGGGSDTTFLPLNTVLIGTGVATNVDGLELLADVRTSEYQSGRVTSLLPGAQYTVPGGRAEFEVRYINVWDEFDQHRSGYRIRSTYRPDSRWAVHGYHADAPESSDGTTVEVRSYALGLEMRLGESSVIRLTGGKELRTAYDRTDVSLALARTF